MVVGALTTNRPHRKAGNPAQGPGLLLAVRRDRRPADQERPWGDDCPPPEAVFGGIEDPEDDGL